MSTIHMLMTGRNEITRPSRFIAEDVRSCDVDVRLAAAEYALLSKGYFVLLSKDKDWAVRVTIARRADTPAPIIDKLSKDEHAWVRRAVEERLALPARTFEPPAEVFKKTSAGRVITAAIPKGALVRGAPGGKCRASAARITSGHGGSLYLPGLMYAQGDTVEVPFFNVSADSAGGAGFYFFCTKGEAEGFDL